MTRLAIKRAALTQAIERRIIQAGDAGITHDEIVRAFNVGRSCVRNHTALLEEEGRIYRVKHKTRGRSSTPLNFLTFHAGSATPTVEVQPARRDWLVAAFFGPAKVAP